METCSFKDWYNEGLWDYAKKAGRFLGNWSPVNPETMPTYPSRYVEPTQRSTPQVQPQKKTVGFRISDMDNFLLGINKNLSFPVV